MWNETEKKDKINRETKKEELDTENLAVTAPLFSVKKGLQERI